MSYAATSTAQSSPGVVRTALASFVGTLIEWYDFFIFGTASALVFNQVFFSNLDPVLGTIVAFATFGVGFVARPIGAIVFGHFGDRIGRKKMLVASLVVMGTGTAVVGVLPTYESWGIWAPLFLVTCRLMQGFAVGGEWGGAVLMAVEHAPARKRAFYGSWPQVSVPVALILAAVSFIAVQQLPAEQFMAWGWRLPFLASVVLIGVGLYIRLRILESPQFEQMKKQHEDVRLPLGRVVRTDWKNLLIGMGSVAAPNIPFYLATVFAVSYAKTDLGLSATFALWALIGAALLEAVMIPVAAIIADRVGARKVLLAGSTFLVALAFPFFALIDSAEPALIAIALALALGVGHAFTYSPSAKFLSELFPTNVRYTGTSVAYHLGGALTSGPVPLVAASLVAWAGSTTPLALYITIGATISLIALACARTDSEGAGFNQPASSLDEQPVVA
jgi:metabolite-proton symporter